MTAERDGTDTHNPAAASQATLESGGVEDLLRLADAEDVPSTLRAEAVGMVLRLGYPHALKLSPEHVARWRELLRQRSRPWLTAGLFALGLWFELGAWWPILGEGATIAHVAGWAALGGAAGFLDPLGRPRTLAVRGIRLAAALHAVVGAVLLAGHFAIGWPGHAILYFLGTPLVLTPVLALLMAGHATRASAKAIAS